MSRCGPSWGIGRALRILGCVARGGVCLRPARASISATEPRWRQRPGRRRAASSSGRAASGSRSCCRRARAATARETARAFRNAAELAIHDFPNAGIQVAVYDTRGTPAGAQAAVGTALGEGAEIILGPVFASEVSAIAPAARQAGVPVVAFSSDASVAGPGVYLLSFLPSDDVNRIVSYSASQGRKSFAALLAGEHLRRGGGGGVPERRRRCRRAHPRDSVLSAERRRCARQDGGGRAGRHADRRALHARHRRRRADDRGRARRRAASPATRCSSSARVNGTTRAS